jgi:hypothetical protein
LATEQEVTKLQRKLLSILSAEPITLKALPKVDGADFADALNELEADVLHVSAHGRTGGIAISLLADGQEHERELKIDNFVRIVEGLRKRPKGIYLSACNGLELAQRLTSVVDFVVANSGDVTNLAARTAALTFYEELARGNCVERAFHLACGMHQTLDPDSTAVLYPKDDPRLLNLRLVKTPFLRARFPDFERGPRVGQPKIELGDESFDIEIEVVNCPRTTTQIIVFTDDDTFIQDVKEDEWEERLCTVLREGTPFSTTATAYWFNIEGNCRLFAAGVVASGRPFTLATTLVRALRRYYDDRASELDDKARKALAAALDLLERQGNIEFDL